MAKSDNLRKAKETKNDEFYTKYEDIQSELNHYEEHFKGKTVLCNADDPFESNFCKFFLRNFNYLGLKRLICTSYHASNVVGTQLSIFDLIDDDTPIEEGHGYVMDITEVPMANGRGVSDADIYKLLNSKKSGVRKLKGNGDFGSEECIKYLQEADIVVTNPPFSLFRGYVELLIKYNKRFLIIGNINCITYKEIFPLIRDNVVWLGTGMGRWISGFIVPDNYELSGTEAYINERGERIVATNNCLWLTNLDHNKRNENLILYKNYSPEEYPNYDNYDAIEVGKTADIPMDYYGEMGVPITFLDKYSPDQFEIVGIAKRGAGDPALKTKIYMKGDYPNYSDLNAGPVLLDGTGHPYNTYPRILIRRKEK